MAMSRALLLLASVAFCPSLAVYNVGVGIGDVTGPAAEVNMMGYAYVRQV